MFISKGKYTHLMYRISELEKAIEEHDEIIPGLVQTSNETDETLLSLSDRIKELEEISESIEENAKKEKDFFDGFSNIMNYEVPNGRKPI